MTLLTSSMAATALAAALALVACDPRGSTAAYRFDPQPAAQGAQGGKPGFSLRYEASLEGKAEGGRGVRPYESRAHARLRCLAVPDTAAGRFHIELAADSIAFAASDRDDAEGRYMQERLSRYKARMVLSAVGRVLAVEEEPEPPPVVFSPLNIGRFLAVGMPAFPDFPVKDGSEWQVEQPLLDKFHPASRVAKRYRVESIRETPDGRLLECAVAVEAWLEDGLGQAGFGSVGDTANPALKGKGEAVFNLDRGIPVSSVLELEGRFTTQVREGGRDSGAAAARVVDQPIQLALRLDLRFSP